MIGRVERPVLTSTGLLIVLMVSAAVAVSVGTADLSVATVTEVLAAKLRLVDTEVPLLTQHIVWELRGPRVVAAALVGGGLSVGGAIVQSLTRNALADPYLLGVSGGAALGAVTVVVLGASILPGALGASLAVAMTTAAFAGGLAALVLVLMLATQRDGTLQSNRLILAGVAIGQLCAAATSCLVLFGGDSDAARRVVQWTLGSVAGARWSWVVVLGIVTTCALAIAMSRARSLDAFAFGERSAAALGVDVNRTRWLMYVLVSLLTASLVSVAGIIGFVGLIVPHAVRAVIGPLHRSLLPVAALSGAVFLVWADVLCRVLLPQSEVPLGIVTAAVGVPLFLALLRRRQVRL